MFEFIETKGPSSGLCPPSPILRTGEGNNSEKTTSLVKKTNALHAAIYPLKISISHLATFAFPVTVGNNSFRA